MNIDALPRGEDGEFPFPPHAVDPTASGTVRWLLPIADDTDDDEEDEDCAAGSGGSGIGVASSGQAADTGIVKASGTGCSAGGAASPVALHDADAVHCKRCGERLP